jgi:hypothetical protein
VTTLRILLKSVTAGCVGALIALLLGGFLQMALALLRIWFYVGSSQQAVHNGSGGLGAVSIGISEAGLYFGLLGFAAGFVWQYKRASKPVA